MKKFLLIGVALVAMLAIPASASADVPRCDETVAVNTTITTATFTVNQPKDTVGQFGNVWRHEFTVVVLPDGSFSGSSSASDHGATTPSRGCHRHVQRRQDGHQLPDRSGRWRGDVQVTR